MDNYDSLFDFIEIFAGLYLVFSGIMAIRGEYSVIKGLIPRSLSEESDEKLKGYFSEVAPFFFICGAAFAIVGLVSIALRLNGGMSQELDLALIVIMLVCCILLGLRMKLVENKYNRAQ
ncbi:MAG: hypothetical protein J6P05_04230 [Lachnospiraceae bacterium]|nr:hypothetical protein [Lachnospiraceae bacterium]